MIWYREYKGQVNMFEEFVVLRNLFVINASRQAELDAHFLSMPDHPSDDQLTILHDIAEHSVPEARALLTKIDEVMKGDERIPKGLLGKMLAAKALVPEQIRNDSNMRVYLENEYKFLRPKAYPL